MPLESPFGAAAVAAWDAARLAAVLEEAQIAAIGGSSWDATRVDASGATVVVGTVDPLYILQVQPTALALALAGTDVPSARWRFVARVATVVALVELDRLTNGTLAFVITALDRVDVPGLAIGTLERS